MLKSMTASPLSKLSSIITVVGPFMVPDRRKFPEADNIIMEARKGVALS